MIGAYRKDGGTVTYKGETLSNSLSRNIEKGIVYLSEDRKDEGLVLMHSVMDNICLLYTSPEPLAHENMLLL